MKQLIFTLPWLLALPLAAQSWEAGLFLGQQSYKSETFMDGPVGALTLRTDAQFAMGLRLGKSIVDAGPVQLQITAGFQPQVTATTHGSLGGPDLGTADLKAQHYSLGAMFTFKAALTVGAGLEYRFEKLEQTNTSTNYARPWLRLSAGYAIPSPVVKPFFGLEVDFALASKEYSDTNPPEDLLKSIAPKSQIGIYAGIRF